MWTLTLTDETARLNADFGWGLEPAYAAASPGGLIDQMERVFDAAGEIGFVWQAGRRFLLIDSPDGTPNSRQVIGHVQKAG